MKINVDSALAKNSRIIVAAAVARDFVGRFLRGPQWYCGSDGRKLGARDGGGDIM